MTRANATKPPPNCVACAGSARATAVADSTDRNNPARANDSFQLSDRVARRLQCSVDSIWTARGSSKRPACGGSADDPGGAADRRPSSGVGGCSCIRPDLLTGAYAARSTHTAVSMDPSFLTRGLAIGFTVAAAVGPISLLTIRRTLAHGRVYGLASGMGVALADASYGGVAAFGLT